MNTTMPLLTPLEPHNKYAPVFERTWANAQVTVSLQPLSLHNWPHVGKWLCREFTRRQAPGAQLPEKYLRETFMSMLQCDFAQPFTGLINELPSFLIEICDGDKHSDGLEEGPHVFNNGDHAIRLILSPTVINTRLLSQYALLTSLEYFFSYPQVKRIVWVLHEKDRYNINLASQLSFKTSATPHWPGIHVFLYPREIFHRFPANYFLQIQKWP